MENKVIDTETVSMVLKKGQWYTYCCHEDICQADEDEEIYVDSMQPRVFDSYIQGLEEIQNDWPVDSREWHEVKQLINKYYESHTKDSRNDG